MFIDEIFFWVAKKNTVQAAVALLSRLAINNQVWYLSFVDNTNGICKRILIRICLLSVHVWFINANWLCF
jgi:hypothetical protein